DLDKVIEIDNTFIYAYFNRAAVRFKKIESMFGISTDKNNTSASLISDEGISEIKNMQLKNGAGFIIKNEQQEIVEVPVQNRSIEYDLIVRDYDKVISLDPGFVYAYYNRANVYSVQKNYKAALADYNEAIKLAPEFADAYYNRAMIYLITGETELAKSDLSKAGELGKYASYNLLKRLSE
ncbi:MAG: tetratricopeptide repeat protein, partial [Bacteroidaceae bacterium]|nr:tetratricopeptide repeat protein [Bacteroidaceae bacterium]